MFARQERKKESLIISHGGQAKASLGENCLFIEKSIGRSILISCAIEPLKKHSESASIGGLRICFLTCKCAVACLSCLWMRRASERLYLLFPVCVCSGAFSNVHVARMEKIPIQCILVAAGGLC